MNIRAYLKKHRLSQGKFAAQLGVTQGAVGHWLTGRAKVDAKRAHEIVRKTNGEITLHDLRSDIFRRSSDAA